MLLNKSQLRFFLLQMFFKRKFKVDKMSGVAKSQTNH